MATFNLFPPAFIRPTPPTPSSAGSTTPPPPTSPSSPTAANIPVPSTWRCGTCGTLNPVQDLMTGYGYVRPDSDDPPSSTATIATSSSSSSSFSSSYCMYRCPRPALQAVYDQAGRIYLFWRDDPAVADLRDPAGLAEARRRVREAGGEWVWTEGPPPEPLESGMGSGLGLDLGPGLDGSIRAGAAFGAGGGRFGKMAGEEGEGGFRAGLTDRRWTRFSQSSAASSRDSLDSGGLAMEE